MMFKNPKSLPFRILKRLGFYLGIRLELESVIQPLAIESMILALLGSRQEVTFLQIGANDANNNNDPLRVLRKNGVWKGWMIEPNPAVFQRLQNSVSNFPEIHCLNCAISEADDVLPFYYIKNPHTTKHPFVADQLSSLSKDHVRLELISWGYNNAQAENAIASVDVSCKSPKVLLKEINISSLDLLLIDAEGYDFRIIKQFPFDLVRPQVIVFEASRLSPQEMDLVPELMHENGYAFWHIGEDVIASRWE